MKSFWRLLQYARPFHRYWPGYVILAILSVIFGVANYTLIKPVVKLLFEAPSSSEVAAQVESLTAATSNLQLHSIGAVKDFVIAKFNLLIVPWAVRFFCHFTCVTSNTVAPIEHQFFI